MNALFRVESGPAILGRVLPALLLHGRLANGATAISERRNIVSDPPPAGRAESLCRGIYVFGTEAACKPG